MAASRSASVSACSISVIFTSCWVIEEPPCTVSPLDWFAIRARSVPWRSSAPCR